DAEPVTPSAAEPEETRAATARTQHFAWDASGAIPLLIGDGERSFLYLSGTTPAAQREADGTVRYLHTDGIGSVRMVTDEAGAVVAGTDYQPYGQALSTGLAPVSDVSDVSEFGYAGERTDATGLLYLRARWYDTATASFLSVDPLVELIRTAYGYTRGNPVQYTDPLGPFWSDPLFWDTVSLGLSLGALVLGATGVGACVAAGLALGAMGAAAVATTMRIRDGEPLLDIALSAAGVVPGLGAYGALGVRGLTRVGARYAGTLTRMTGSGSRHVANSINTAGRWAITPGAAGGTMGRAIWCYNLAF
ncbi:hypothetical protein MHY85_20935, partial [Cellulomonas sp. ACRRI]|uniref:RHS repeat-associated core domain-containing protein n=1 Tax=Cellulomonas sp. ACRRI TaxID=2918188 RepID=UPI001EF352E4